MGAPQGGEKILRRNLQGKCVSTPPQDTKYTPQLEQKSIFRTFFAERVRFEGILLRATTKKGR